MPYPAAAQAWDLSGIVVIGINPNPPLFVRNIEEQIFVIRWSL